MLGLVAGPCIVAWNRSASVIVAAGVVATWSLWLTPSCDARPPRLRAATRGRRGPVRLATIVGMTATPSADQQATPTDSLAISVLLYSNDRSVRDAVRLGVGDRPADDVVIEQWVEVATPEMAVREVRNRSFDVLILDGESQPYGGMGVSRQLKNEIFDCPPVVVLTGRPVDGWLATWSLADLSVPRPLDPARLSAAVAELARR
jgi:CheY-like chemotaxis protein